ncbi:hypothetical protein NYQ10_06350 [Flavobacterium johnsoniae]|uniref:hypothetical protein n=1 Tax=Flavobacterium johnsoniae TaxID=986 RepID=UPI0025B15B81|nr:hypothetical protein [Flavobacterium johnsoniae]WJS96072.1 hypothetical protein NYQ10_06350 [Flavobacterium johnsoniae]
METKNQILKTLGFSDEFIAQINASNKFVCHEPQADFEMTSVETEDFTDLIIEEVDSPFKSEIIL